jgi:hypothetical protein
MTEEGYFLTPKQRMLANSKKAGDEWLEKHKRGFNPFGSGTPREAEPPVAERIDET